MHHYPHHIGDFNNATRHLTRLERGIYRDLMELYYDTESPLPKDINSICRKILARDQQEVTAVEQVLNEFFYLTDEGHVNDRCQDVIEAYQNSIHNKRAAGKKSAKARKLLKQNNKSGSTGVDLVLEQNGNRTATGVHNQEPEPEPITNNHKPLKDTSKSKYKFEPDHYQLAVELSNPVKQRFSTQSINLDEWADAIRKLVDIDKYTIDQIYHLWRWRTDHQGNNGFTWADNIRTPMKLRQKKDGLSYFEILKNQMRVIVNENNQGFNTSGRPSLVERVAENGRQFLRDKGIIEEPGEYLGGETLDQVNGDVRT